MKGRGPADLRGLGIVRASVDVTAFRKMSSNHPRLARAKSSPIVAHFRPYRFCVKCL